MSTTYRHQGYYDKPSTPEDREKFFQEMRKLLEDKPSPEADISNTKKQNYNLPGRKPHRKNRYGEEEE
jgi:hypothetical protein